MILRVTCGGVLVGTADFDPPAGLAYARLVPADGYFSLAELHAHRIAALLAQSYFWPPENNDFADAVAAHWNGGRLSLEDSMGNELGVTNIVLIERLLGALSDPSIIAVADFRPDLARVEAFLRTIDIGGGSGRSRPAA
jgi:hypothetical protein